MSVIFCSEFCFLLMFHSTFYFWLTETAIFIFSKRRFCLHLTTCQIVSPPQKAHETDDESEDNSDFRVVAASLMQKKKSGPTSVKQHYVQERLPWHMAVSSPPLCLAATFQ